jgi:predicted porin
MNPVIATNSVLMTTAGNSVSTMTSGAMNFSDFFTRNAITYTSPSFNGLVAQVQRGMSQSVNSDSAGSVTAFSLAYVNGPMELRFANQDRKGAAAATAVNGANQTTPAYVDTAGTAVAAAASGDKKTTIAGVKYNLGAWTVAAATYKNDYSTSPGGAMTNVKGNGLSASYKLNAQTTLGVARMSGRTTGDSSTLTHLQARYELSKRTQLYSVYGVANNASSGIKFWPYASNTNGVTGSTTSPSVAIWDAGTPGTGGVAGKNQSAVGVGVIHTF